MHILIVILVAIRYLIDLINILIIIRAVLSWVPQALDNKFGSILMLLTEPAMIPARKLLYKFEFARNLPVDFTPWLAVIILYFINWILNTVISILSVI